MGGCLPGIGPYLEIGPVDTETDMRLQVTGYYAPLRAGRQAQGRMQATWMRPVPGLPEMTACATRW